MGPLLIFVTLSLLVSLALGDSLEVNLEINEINCLFGCFDALALVGYGDIPATAGYYDGYCSSAIFTTSIASCGDLYCTTKQVKKGWDTLTDYCVEYGLGAALLALDDVRRLANSSETVDTIAMAGTIYNSTIVPDRKSFDIGEHTEDAWNREMNFHHAFGWSMYILFGSIILASMVGRGLSVIRRRSQASFWPAGRTWYQKHVGAPALFGKRHAQSWQVFSLPTRLQAIVIALYVLINFVFCAADYDLFFGNLYWADTETQLARYIADRTGIICFYNMPLLFVLGGRNDVFLWLTGWSYATASLLHRWVAFVATMQAIVHSICYTWLERDYIALEWDDMYWRAGVFATIIMSLLVVCSLRPIRARFYETFLIVHILMAVVCLVLLFYHVEIFEHEYDPWLWACVGVWCLDRFIRLARLAILSFRTWNGANTVATLTYRESGLIRLSVTPSIPLNPKPGHYYYLYTPWSLTPWENHPMTMASFRDGKLNFLIGPKDGATRRLQRRLERKSGTDNIRILLEGPYGVSHNLQHFDRILLIAGGSGITAILPYFAKYGNRCSIVWAVTREDYAADVLASELSNAQAQVYISREESTPPSSSPMGEKDFVLSSQITRGRPSMPAVVSKAVNDLIGGERLAVVACGPGGMMDEIRAAVVAAYGKVSADQVEYFEDAFGW